MYSCTYAYTYILSVYIYVHPCIISIFTATCTLIQWYLSFTTALCVAQVLDWKKVTLQFSFPEIGAWPVITRWGSNVSSLGFVVDISIADGVTNWSGHLPLRFLRICWRWNRFIRKMFGSHFDTFIYNISYIIHHSRKSWFFLGVFLGVSPRLLRSTGAKIWISGSATCPPQFASLALKHRDFPLRKG